MQQDFREINIPIVICLLNCLQLSLVLYDFSQCHRALTKSSGTLTGSFEFCEGFVSLACLPTAAVATHIFPGFLFGPSHGLPD